MIRKIEGVAALDAEKIPVRAALVAVVAADDLHAGVGTAHAQRRLTSIPAVCADRAHMLHLPRTRLVTIRAGSERAHGTNVDAHPAFFALQVVLFIRSNNRTHAAVLHAQSPNVHPLAADT